MPHSRRTRYLFAVIAIILSNLAVAPRETAAASCSGQSHEMALSDGAASPRKGMAGSGFTFRVTYTDNVGCPPAPIVVRIFGIGRFDLLFAGGSLTAGATYETTVALPAGRWSYAFEATSGTGAGKQTFTLTAVDPAKVVVVAPTPPPPATPPPTPRPTPTPKPTPKPTSAATATPLTPPPTTVPTPTVGATPTVSGPPPTATQPAHPTASPAGGAGGRTPGSVTGPPGLDGVPRPWLALAVAAVGTVIGLVLFALMSIRLIDPGPGAALVIWRRSRSWPPTPPRSEP